MKQHELDLALKDPEDLSLTEMDAVLEAQLTVLRAIRKEMDPDPHAGQAKKSKPDVKRRSLRNLKNKV